MIVGHATKDGTSRYKDRFKSWDYRRFGGTNLLVSELGFGSYRVDVSVENHAIALKKALKEGINLIDTSSNYSNGGSERLICEVMNSLIEDSSIQRDEIVIISKAGYIQGDNYKISEKRKEEGRAFEDLVEYEEGLEHCISPEFLKDQLSMSLMRLGLSTIDFYLLHNPEYYLNFAAKNNIDLDKAREVYYERIKKAFLYLEEEVKNGRIKAYGISSNTFIKEESEVDATSISRVLSIAKSISSEHNFKLAQFPMNLYECSAGFNRSVSINAEENAKDTKETKDTEDGKYGKASNKVPLLVYLKSNNIASVVNRPLNALLDGNIVRLADVSLGKIVSDDKVDNLLDSHKDLESKFQNTYIVSLEIDDDTKKQLLDYLLIGNLLRDNWRKFTNYTQWYNVFSTYFIPRINSAVELLRSKDLSVPLSYWVDNYADSVNRVFTAIDSYYKVFVDISNRKLKSTLQEELESFLGDSGPSKLSQMAVYALRSSFGISSILVGMRQDIYVDDMLSGLSTVANQKDNTELWSVLNGKLNFAN